MIRLRAFQNPVSGFSYEFYMWDAENRSAGKQVIFQEQSPATRMEPIFSLEKQACQELMDTLWAVGIRPSEGVPSAGQLEEIKETLEAVRYHLEDMRGLALHGKDSV
jgi:hypothetical protein